MTMVAEDEGVFVTEGSVLRKIWGSADTILFIFAGAAAEFALNKSVDWLYFTGKLPADPIGRLFSTVGYARAIVFSREGKAHSAISNINAIHRAVEDKRGRRIPPEAYRDVLFMLIDYSIRAFELLERPLTAAEKEEIFSVFILQGQLMHLEGLPTDFHSWQRMRQRQLVTNLENGRLTEDLFNQYRLHLGAFRYRLLLNVQTLLVPREVKSHLTFLHKKAGPSLLAGYRLLNRLGVGKKIRNMLLPAEYRERILAMDTAKRRCPFHR